MEFLNSVIYIAVTGLVSFYLGALIPRHLFFEQKFPFKTYKWEDGGKIYEKLNIRKWKGEILDMSKIMTIILPKKEPLSATAKDVKILVAETCVAEFVHWILCVISVGHWWIWKKSIEGIVMWILCVLGNLPFILVQRYNRPHLIILRGKLIKREKLQNCEG